VPENVEVLIVGAGLAGLACAGTLGRAGIEYLVVEAGDGPGGRVRTDHVDGYQLDRGFQILLTAYPELTRHLDLAALDLQAFRPGALVQLDDRRVRVGDPLRRPADLPSSALAAVGTVADKVRLARLLLGLRRGDGRSLTRRPDETVAERLAALGFSATMVERFFRPLIGGIQLDPTLGGSARSFDLVLRMLALGDAAVPARGMGAISEQMAGSLAPGALHTDTPVDRLRGTTAHLADGRAIDAATLVVATDGATAATLLDLPPPGRRSAACVWFATEVAPVAEPVLVLDGTSRGPVRNVAPLSIVAPSYAPAGRHLVAAAVPGPDARRPSLEADVRSQLTGWFGPVVAAWDTVRVDVIDFAQPDQPPPLAVRSPVALGHGRYVCGDHRDTASIQGALVSGRRTAEAILAQRSLRGSSLRGS